MIETFPDRSVAEGAFQETWVFGVPTSTVVTMSEGHEWMVGEVVSTKLKDNNH